MVYIRRKFRVGVNAEEKEEIDSILKSIGILTLSYKYFYPEIPRKLLTEPRKEDNIVKVYFECTSSEDELNALIDFLRDKFKGFASVTY